jgi:hypothetical protein
MSKIYKFIKQDIVKSMKEKNGETVLLRCLDSSIQTKVLDARREISDDLVIEVIEKSVKQRRESIEAFQKGNRDDLVKKETYELEVLTRYLPEQLADIEIEKIVKESIKTVNVLSIKDMGKVMGIVMKQTKGKADSKKVSDFVKASLMI